MPCRDYGADEYYRGSTLEVEKALLRERGDMLARIACQAMDGLAKDAPGTFAKLMVNPEVFEWYTQHKKEDEKRQKENERNKKAEEKRLEKQRIRNQVLAKLTKEEIEAFGLKG